MLARLCCPAIVTVTVTITVAVTLKIECTVKQGTVKQGMESSATPPSSMTSRAAKHDAHGHKQQM